MQAAVGSKDVGVSRAVCGCGFIASGSRSRVPHAPALRPDVSLVLAGAQVRVLPPARRSKPSAGCRRGPHPARPCHGAVSVEGGAGAPPSAPCTCTGSCFRARHRVGLCGLNWMLGTVSEPSCDPFEGSCQFSWVTTAPPQTEKGQGRAQSPRYSAPQGTREGNLLALTHRGHPWVYSYSLPLPADCFRWHKSLAVL